MLLPAVLLTPMILAAEPIRLEVPDTTYNHRTQTSTINGDAAKRKKLAMTGTSTQGDGFRNHDYDSDW